MPKLPQTHKLPKLTMSWLPRALCRDTTKANDEEVTKNLMGLVQTRPDIFGGCLFAVARRAPAPSRPDGPCRPGGVWPGRGGARWSEVVGLVQTRQGVDCT